MLKRFALVLLCAMALVRAYAVPVYPYPVTVTQPDGSTLEIQGHGDEFYNFITTADGYTVVKNDAGYYVYATLQNNRLAPTTLVARNQLQRSAADNAFLQATGKMLHEVQRNQASQKARRQVATRETDDFYANFRGLVILVNFTDRQFSRSDYKSVITNMLNKENYTGYTNVNGSSNTYGSMFLGSVRDYFSDNSCGKFAPQFDVVGPVTVSYASTDIQQTSYAPSAFYEALSALDSSIDYSQYDADGDGYVDMIYFIAAGYGANYSGNNTNYLWPHKWSLAQFNLTSDDGVKFGTYACSTELYGWESQSTTVLDGIGTICHEFSHVIGLPDVYDTDYEENGQSHDPGQWDVMAGGSYMRYGRRPVGYSAYERYALGFLTPKVFSKAGTYTLNPMQSANEAYMLKTPIDKEYFLFENRQQSGWDVELPGHGMLVSRVDSTNTSVWTSNQVNANSDRNYLELLRAGNGTSGASASDPFPGTAGVTDLTANTQPALTTWNGTVTEYFLSNIAETNGVISFKLNKAATLVSLVEDFETIGTAGVAGTTGVQGRFCDWDFTKSNVVTPTKSGVGEGQYALAMTKPSAITTSNPLTFNPFMASVHFYNSSSVACKFSLLYRLPDSETWTEISNVSLTAGTDQEASFTIPSAATNAYFRISQTAGSTTAKVYADNITFYYYRTAALGDLNADGAVDVADVTVLLNMVLDSDTSNSEADINADGTIDIADVTALINLILG
ncbi:MAG: M6 family metalloprotease domain-containing protein [Sodaliphilus sp.]